jgi:hypothetical protein
VLKPVSDFALNGVPLVPELDELARPLNGQADLLKKVGGLALADVVKGAHPHGTDYETNIFVLGHDNGLRPGRVLGDALEQIESVAVRQLQIQQHDVELRAVDQRDGLFGGSHGSQHVAVGLQDLHALVAEGVVIVYE